MADDTGPVGGRSKRQKLDKYGRSAAFEKLRNLKGTKHKYEDKDIENVYEEVDEREYSKRVLERQDDDWIEDDGILAENLHFIKLRWFHTYLRIFCKRYIVFTDGAGYVEDGREIFDDDMDDEAISQASKKTPKGRTKKNEKFSKESAAEVGKSNNIRSMFMNIPTKKKKEVVKLDEDKILGDLMQELNSSPLTVKPSPILRPPIRQTTSYETSNFSRMSSDRLYTSRSSPSDISSRISSHSDKHNSGPAVKRKLEDENSYPTESQNIEEIESQPVKATQDVIEDIEDSLDDEDFAMISQVEENEKSLGNNDQVALKNANGSKNVEVMMEEEVITAEVKKHDNFARNVFEDSSSMRESPDSEEQTVDAPTVKLEEGTLPLEKSCDGKVEEVLRFFWLDAMEGPPGTVYMFGKVRCGQQFVYLLPREEEVNTKTGQSTGKKISIMDVYKEFNDEVATDHRIFEFKSKKYAFDLPGVPLSCEYLEVRYPASHGALPRDFSGRTISRVFGTETSFLELLLLERRIKGPCWIEVHRAEAAKSRLSWCVVEAVAENVDAIVPISRDAIDGPLGAAPLLSVLSLSLRTAPNQRTGSTEVVLILGILKKDFRCDAATPTDGKKQKDESFCIIARPDRVPWPIDCDAYLRSSGRKPPIRVDSERALLSVFLGKMNALDPDVVVGHGISDFEVDVLTQRIATLGVSQPSRIGRLRRGNDPRHGKGHKPHPRDRFPLAGRLMCDTKLSAKELIKARSYELRPLCRKVLHGCEEDSSEEQVITDKDEVINAFSSGDNLAKLVSRSVLDACQVLRLLEAFDALPLAMQITNIAGNIMSRTLAGGRSERNEFLLLHAFTERGYIVPDKTFGKARGKDGEEGGKNASYAGGLVLDPKVGLYDTLILLMDFNSLYPSIIQEYNICFTTLSRDSLKMAVEDNFSEKTVLPNVETEPGVLPSEIRKLVESRRAVKKLMASPSITSAQYKQYDVRQMALKLTANSMYGCLGFGGSRFQARELAALITAKGREILSRTRDHVQVKMAMNVVYGDTDSVMIDTGNKGDYDAAIKIGSKIKAEVNKMYRQVELDVDGVFERMLLLKKKKYAALTLEKKGNQFVRNQELKGLDIVRRDWSRISVDAGKYVVSQLLGVDDLSAALDDRLEKITSFLETLKVELESGKVPLKKLIISKQLTKTPESYSDGKSLPHVQVALRYNAQAGNRPLMRGDTVPYVVCDDGTTNSAAKRAYHPDEIAKGQSFGENPIPLKVDVHYYLAQQIHPVVSRLCEPIEGMDANRIAVSLGKFSFVCMDEKCRQVNELDGPLRVKDSSVSYALESCINPECSISPLEYIPSICNSLTIKIRKHFEQYYSGYLICEDPGCPKKVRRVPAAFRGHYPICCGCFSGCMMRELKAC
ncbi:hypothetical protein J437_LFUL007804 [Ladona fulva]|uniref:DNA polymerase n=1 Tax=Ladona fulva TaxID=123851 RepID=A0A8K0JT38_LADFU|nr:hypothetical protein J437_LFUL007804 [Ladona fulva]